MRHVLPAKPGKEGAVAKLYEDEYMEFEAFEALAARIERLLAASPDAPVLIAIDGRCGAGKTTLAAELAGRFAASATLHTDDYYLPPERRVSGWEHIPCANMELERLRDEALLPLRAGYTGSYRAYCCSAGAYRAGGALEPQQLVIVEGSYSQHPMLAGFYALKIFVTCSPAEQARRLMAREGERYAAFAARWIPLEEAYFARYAIEQKAHFVLHT